MEEQTKQEFFKTLIQQSNIESNNLVFFGFKRVTETPNSLMKSKHEANEKLYIGSIQWAWGSVQLNTGDSIDSPPFIFSIIFQWRSNVSPLVAF